ncbi:MAG: hypothetical protein AAFY56_11910 [Pseudomonadota bacterium]
MDTTDALVARLPTRTEQIRRYFWRDSEFRGFCEDFRSATEMLERLEQEAPPDLKRLAEYQGLVAEMLDEAVAILEGEER